MYCPFCGYKKTIVVSTIKGAFVVTRFRKCVSCLASFTTAEKIKTDIKELREFEENLKKVGAKDGF